MSQIIELFDPLSTEIQDYADAVSTPPHILIRQAWEEFRNRHPASPMASPLSPDTIKDRIRTLSGSLSLPQNLTYDQLLESALLDKYGPV